jgi:hypothetical protein
MKFTRVLFALSALLPVALCDGAAITSAMQEIITDTISLNTTISGYNGEILKLIKILGESTDLLSSIKEGTKVAKDSEPLNTLESLGIAQETQLLAAAVSSSLSTIVGKKKVFQKRLLQPAILLTLKQQQSASSDFSAAVVEKVPEELQAVAESLVARIEDAFEQAIAEYKEFP